MNYYTFNKNKKTLLVKATVSSLTITGSENIITLESKIPNLVISGNHNQIIARYNHSEISNVVLNGHHNSINATNTNFYTINNGKHNSVNNNPLGGLNIGNNSNTVFNNFQNSSFNITVDNRNVNNIFNINHILNMVAGVNQANMGFHQNEEYDVDDNYSNGDEQELEEGEGEIEEETDIFNNDNNNQQLDSRINIILDLNEFQYKHVNKYVSKLEEKCSLCKVKFNKTDIIRQFACGDHIFHRKCLAKWLTKSDLCPLCKYDLNKGIIDNSKPKQMSNIK